MNLIHREPTFRTPEIKFDPENHLFFIKGRSLPEDANDFYAPYKKWLESYFTGPVNDSDFIFQVDYFNSSSSRIILEIMYLLRDSINEGNKINIIWKYEEHDDEMMSVGEEIQTIIEVPIQIESIPMDD